MLTGIGEHPWNQYDVKISHLKKGQLRKHAGSSLQAAMQKVTFLKGLDVEYD